MITLALAVLSTALLTFGAAAQTGGAAATPVVATVDAGKPGAPVSPYLYGQFIEHIGDLVNRSLWAEMLDDRKFYNPIVANPGEQGAGQARQPLAADRSGCFHRDGPPTSLPPAERVPSGRRPTATGFRWQAAFQRGARSVPRPPKEAARLPARPFRCVGELKPAAPHAIRAATRGITRMRNAHSFLVARVHCRRCTARL